jgi:hypothetical protein
MCTSMYTSQRVMEASFEAEGVCQQAQG